MLARAPDAAGPVAEETSPFDVGFDKVASFTRKRRRNMPLVLLGEEGVRGVARLQQALLASLAASDLVTRAEPSFTPHLTLLYDDIALPPQATAKAMSWRVDEMLLVRSHLGQARHEVLARLPLRGSAKAPARGASG